MLAKAGISFIVAGLCRGFLLKAGMTWWVVSLVCHGDLL